jgi:hypothetical protein
VRPFAAIATGIVAALALIALTTVNLTSQGLYYDEVTHARNAFFYRGVTPQTAVRYHNIPVLTQTYNGAIKEHLYGPYLAYAPFTVRSWRLVGPLVVATGIVAFAVVVRRVAPVVWMATFASLLLTDSTVILTTRHDWGSTAFALATRLLLVGIWMHRELRPGRLDLKTFLLGVMVGIAIFDKLSAVVLLVPLVLMIGLSLHRPRWTTWGAAAAGVTVGLSPLIAVNLWIFLSYGGLVSLADVGMQIVGPVPLADFLWGYPAMGLGAELRTWILGLPTPPLLYWSELLLNLSLVVAVVTAAWRLREETVYIRMAGVMVLGYIAVGVGLRLLPQATWVHHWILGTPFQYAAIGCAITAWTQLGHRSQRRPILLFIMIATVGLLLVRLPAVAAVERAFADGRASIDFDPSFSRLGEFADENRTALFIAADWGIAAQIYCLTDGTPDLVYELFRSTQVREETTSLIRQTTHERLYLLSRRQRAPARPAETAIIEDTIGSSALWHEVPAEPEIRNLRAVHVRKFLRMAQQSEAQPGAHPQDVAEPVVPVLDRR